MNAPAPLHLFEGYGIELEYMIVDAHGLQVRPMADQLLAQVGGGYELEVEMGPAGWSNELALHVIEMKTNGPTASLAGLGAMFQAQVDHMQSLLRPMGAHLLPSAMHPFMNPDRELRLWPHENDVIYKTFDRIFDCRGHGWANLQSTHINLPFANDDEFGRLHAAVRLVLPLLPALAASSPLMEGRPTGQLDTRLDTYRHNARQVPSVSGRVIPERVFTRAEYEGSLLQGIYRDLAPLDPEGVLRHEWVNARGAIARFDRMAVEIRVLDIQECPAADIAVAAAVTGVVRALTEQRWTSTTQQQAWDERLLEPLLLAAIGEADEAVVADASFLANFGFPESGPARLCDVWQHLIETLLPHDPCYAEWQPALSTLMEEGPLARRILRATGPAPSHDEILAVYARLAECLRCGALFRSRA